MNKNIENNPMNHGEAKVYEVGETAASKARGALTALEDEFATAGVFHARKQIGDDGYRPQVIHSQVPVRIVVRWNRLGLRSIP